jgi:hypothetical protein
MSRDFRHLVFFFHQTTSPLSPYGLKITQIFDYKIVDFWNSSVNDTTIANIVID